MSPALDRRDLLKLLAAAPLAAHLAAPTSAAAAPAPAAPGIVKPLPPELFTIRGTNAETNFTALRSTGLHTPADHFFVRNHTSTPVLGESDWKLTVWGSGLSGRRPVEFSYGHLRSLPSVTRTAVVECAGNGRNFYATQQGETVTGTPWTLGGIGAARWRGVRLRDVLRHAGISSSAVDVMPRGLDDEFISNGVNHGRVRRPLPVGKALDDVILVYEMNGEPLPYDHGYPVRVIVPSWIGIASIKWLGDIEVSETPLSSPWTTEFYRLFGAAYPSPTYRWGDPMGGSAPISRQTHQERPGAAARREPRGRRRAPADRPRLVGQGTGQPCRDLHRRRNALAPGTAARHPAPGQLGPLDGGLAPASHGTGRAAGPYDGPRGQHSARAHGPQHPGLSLRRGGQAPGHRGLTPGRPPLPRGGVPQTSV